MDAGFVERDGAQTNDATRADEAVRSQRSGRTGLADALLERFGRVFSAVIIGAIAMGSVAAVSPSWSLDDGGAR